MAWVLLGDQETGIYFSSNGASLSNGRIMLDGSDVSGFWSIQLDEPRLVRITAEYYIAGLDSAGSIYHPANLFLDDEEINIINTAPPYPATTFPNDDGVQAFSPSVVESPYPVWDVAFGGTLKTSDYLYADWSYSFLVEIWEDDGPTPPAPTSTDRTFRVYELDRGWSFDGAYIPHFLELNWYFGEDPFTDKTIQKVRIHGLSKGLANVSLAVAGMQTEYDSDYTEGQHIPLPRNAAHITTEYFPVTNYVDSSNWGVSMQMKFEGSNTDLTKPEPSHVLQVLALQSSPQGNGKRIN